MKLEDDCLFFDKMHAFYNKRSNLTLLCEKDSIVVMNIIPL